MTNWQMREQITFLCPDCGHIQHEMIPECPACKNIRTASVRPGYSVHHISFGMNGGRRKEIYHILLTNEQATAFSTLPGFEAYNFL
jgi:hypothetical protein